MYFVNKKGRTWSCFIYEIKIKDVRQISCFLTVCVKWTFLKVRFVLFAKILHFCRFFIKNSQNCCSIWKKCGDTNFWLSCFFIFFCHQNSKPWTWVLVKLCTFRTHTRSKFQVLSCTYTSSTKQMREMMTTKKISDRILL